METRKIKSRCRKSHLLKLVDELLNETSEFAKHPEHKVYVLLPGVTPEMIASSVQYDHTETIEGKVSQYYKHKFRYRHNERWYVSDEHYVMERNGEFSTGFGSIPGSVDKVTDMVLKQFLSSGFFMKNTTAIAIYI